MIAADPGDLEVGEEAMLHRVMDGLNQSALKSLLTSDLKVTSVHVDGLTLAAHKGEPVFQLDLTLDVMGQGAVDIPLPHISGDKEELARRSRRFWRKLVQSHSET